MVLSQLIGAQYNPLGVENSFRLGLCSPLIERPGILFEYTHVEIGVLNYLSPAFTHIGTYFQITPLSLLQFRIEVSWVAVWPFFFDRAGFYNVDGYDSNFSRDALPAEEAGTETGWNINLVTILRARIRLGPVALVVLDQLNYEYWSIGEQSHNLNLRRDLVLARSDWVLYNEAILCLEIPLTSSINMRIGGFDSLRWVPSSGYLGNLAGGILMFHWPETRHGVRDLSPFIRVGGYTNHAFRRGEFSAVLGLLASYDLGTVR